ncbi:hypothetical protein TEA_009775 [Camellia sinensis var. sinensis]|uniref:Uncharacterized protein n=1 Tax=Camellia sinensis var. sinensis TaxID=542762 RepID=A0A4S4DZ75_CAMSN|nr:hypothetical protein TEA_009775 [Camellia sinensis var. sinensis]
MPRSPGQETDSADEDLEDDFNWSGNESLSRDKSEREVADARKTWNKQKGGQTSIGSHRNQKGSTALKPYSRPQPQQQQQQPQQQIQKRGRVIAEASPRLLTVLFSPGKGLTWGREVRRLIRHYLSSNLMDVGFALRSSTPGRTLPLMDSASSLRNAEVCPTTDISSDTTVTSPAPNDIVCFRPGYCRSITSAPHGFVFPWKRPHLGPRLMFQASRASGANVANLCSPINWLDNWPNNHLDDRRALHNRNKKAMELIAKGWSALKEVDRVIDYAELKDKRLIPLLRTAKENFELALEADNSNTHARYWLSKLHLKYHVPGACKAMLLDKQKRKSFKTRLYLFMDHISIPIAQVKYIINTLCLFHHNRGAALLVEAADMGDPDAQYELGCQLRVEVRLAVHDNDYVQSDQQAFYYLEKAVDQLHPGALYLLGAVYLTGDCVKKDVASALWCFHRASEKGHAGAAIAYGSLILRVQFRNKLAAVTSLDLNPEGLAWWSRPGAWGCAPFSGSKPLRGKIAISACGTRLALHCAYTVNVTVLAAHCWQLFTAHTNFNHYFGCSHSGDPPLEIPSGGASSGTEMNPAKFITQVLQLVQPCHWKQFLCYCVEVPESLTKFNSKRSSSARKSGKDAASTVENPVEMAREQFEIAARAGCDLGFKWLQRLEEEEKRLLAG